MSLTVKRSIHAFLLTFALAAVPALAADATAAATVEPGAADEEAPALAVEAAGCEVAPASGIASTDPVAMACYDLTCEWRDKCANDGWGNKTYYKEKYCFTNCGYYWYSTGETCCYRSSPGSC